MKHERIRAEKRVELLSESKRNKEEKKDGKKK